MSRMPPAREPSSVYRIERQDDGALHLYRDRQLVDIDHENDVDALSHHVPDACGIAVLLAPTAR